MGQLKLGLILDKSSCLIILVLAILLLPSHSYAQSWYDTGWAYRKNVTFNSSQVGEDNLTSFPVLISVTDSNLSTFAQADGDDILFTQKQQNNVANNTYQMFYDTAGTCTSKVGYNGTHTVWTAC
jgi:hypothetical protein